MFLKFLLLSSLTFAVFAADPKVVTDAKALSKAGKYEEAITALEGGLKSTPKDAPAIKKALSETYTAMGDASMYNEQLPPFRKYPAALRAYRKAVENDKTNKKAADNIATIEGIYKSMGRPIPQ